MAILKVAQIGNPALREPCSPIDEQMLGDGEIRRLLCDMVETMREYEGVGLAAPQVRCPLRAFVMEVAASERYPDCEPVELQLVLNPVITVLDSELEEDWEGCLSIAGLRGQVPRHRTIRMEGISIDGETLTSQLDGFAARVAQHEADHLDGVVYLDRMADMSTLTDEREYQRAKSTREGGEDDERNTDA